MSKKLAGSGRYRSRKTGARENPSTPPKIPGSIDSLFLAVDQSKLEKASGSFQERIVTSQIQYKPGILASARVTFEGTRWEIFHERDVIRVISYPAAGHPADWEKNLIEKWDQGNVLGSPESNSCFVVDENQDFTLSNLQSLQEQFIDHLTTNETLELIFNPQLRLHRQLDETEEVFFNRCLERLREDSDQELKQLEETILRREERLKEKLDREFRERGLSATDVRMAKNEDTGGRSETESSTRTAASLAELQAEIEVQESLSHMEEVDQELSSIQKEREEKLREFNENLVSLAQQREKDIVRVNRGNVKPLRFAVLWLPFTEFIIQEEGRRRIELVQSFR